jgi:hypothetical protein
VHQQIADAPRVSANACRHQVGSFLAPAVFRNPSGLHTPSPMVDPGLVNGDSSGYRDYPRSVSNGPSLFPKISIVLTSSCVTHRSFDPGPVPLCHGMEPLSDIKGGNIGRHDYNPICRAGPSSVAVTSVQRRRCWIRGRSNGFLMLADGPSRLQTSCGEEQGTS